MLVVTDPGVISAGWTESVKNSLESSGCEYAVFSGVTSNPKDEEVMAGVEVYRKEKCDVIVAVGGGSPIDCAKGIGIVSSNKKHILEFEGVDNVFTPIPPLICIPTTGGTSADVSQFAIITDTENRVKKSIISKMIVPDISLIDPRTLTTMPSELTASTGLDALVHAIEAYVSNASSPITDLFSLNAISLIASNLIPSIKEPGNLELRSKIMQGSLEAGLAFSNASLGAVHAMAHSLGGFLDFPHGVCNSILLCHVVDYNYESTPERYQRIGQVMGLDIKGLDNSEQKSILLEEISKLKNDAGISETLGQMGLQSENIPEIAQKAMVDPCMVTNPRNPVQRDIEAIYEHAL